MPGATQIFADALFDGDTKKLFSQMEKGLIRMPELNKVIDFMATLKDDELIARSQKSPERAMQRMNNAVTRLFMTLNDAGLLDAMTKALTIIADGVTHIDKQFKLWLPTLKDIWSVVKPMLTLWATVWGVKKIYQLAAAMRVLAVSVGLVSAAGSGGLLGGKVGGLGRISKLIGKVGLLKTTMLLLNRAWLVFGGIIKKSFIAVGILALIDMLETLQGKRTVLTELMGGDGIIAIGAKILVGAFRTMQMLMELVIAGFHGFFTGDWGFFKDSWDRWKESMNSLFPFDKWTEQFTNWMGWLSREFIEVGKLAIGVTNPLTAVGAITKYSGFRDSQELIALRNQTPQLLRAPEKTINPMVFNTEIVINGTGLNQQQMTAAFKDAMVSEAIKAKANYVMAR